MAPADIENQAPGREMEDGSGGNDETLPLNNHHDIDSDEGSNAKWVVAWIMCGPFIGPVLVVLAAVLALAGPFTLMMFILKWSTELEGEKWKKMDEREGSADDSSSPVRQVQYMYTHKARTAVCDKVKKLREIGTGRGLGILLPLVTLLLLVCLASSAFISRVNKLTVLGSPLWKWSLQGVAITYSYFVAIFLWFLIECVIPSENISASASYYSRRLWLGRSVMVYLMAVLVSWLAYFRTDSGLMTHPSTKRRVEVFECVTWTLVSLFVGSILWFFKTLLLLKWNASAIYGRYLSRILVTDAKYDLVAALIKGDYKSGVFSELGVFHKANSPTNIDSVLQHIMPRKLELEDLEFTCDYLMSTAQTMSSLEDDGVPTVLQQFKKQFDKCEPEKKDELYERLKGQDSSSLQDNDNSSNVFTLDDLEKWMVDAHKDCVNMGRTLVDSKAIVTRLDIFISSMIFVVALFAWLLITGILSTKVLVTIATPLLALSFMFGDTAKAFFQGLVFCSLTLPFNVGDRCVIDQTELEVKSISILTTTFAKIESKESIFYPNSVLSTKAIVSLGWQPDPSDVVELTLGPSTNIDDLEDQIMKYVSENKHRYEGSHNVMIKEVGDNIKVTVSLTHVLTVHDFTHSQCSRKKKEQRSHFLKVIKRFLNESSTRPILVNKDGNNSLVTDTIINESESVEVNT